VPTPSVDEAVPIEHRVDPADRRQLHAERALAQLLADLRRAPAGILAFQSDDRRFDRAGSRFAWRYGRRLRSVKACTPQSLYRSKIL
jgi:hypothetical protein